jgi:cytochrome c553
MRVFFTSFCGTAALLGLLAGQAAGAAQGETATPDIETTLTTCYSCHGENGAAPIDPTYAILAGQHQFYIYQQLKDYKSGLREHPLMSAIAAGLEKQQMLSLGEYFSKQPWPGNERDASAANIARGKAIATSGQCVQCHLGGFLGASGVPRLAGQQFEYLRATMLAFKNRTRKNAAAKNSLFADYSDDDIEAVADYLASMDSGQIRR